MPSRANGNPNSSNARTGLPRFDVPEVVGTAMSPAELGQVVTESIQQVAIGLQCRKVVALAFDARQRRLRGVGAVGPGFEQVAIREVILVAAESGILQKTIQTGRIETVDSNIELPTVLQEHFSGQTVIVPLMLSDRCLAVIVGEVEPGVVSRSAEWQARAVEVSARAALVVELERVAAAYHDEVSLRVSRRVLAAAILEDRPIQEIGDLILQIVCQRLRIDRAGLFVRDVNGKYSSSALRNLPEDYTERIMKLPRPGPVMARAIATGLPYFARNVQTDEQFDPEARALFRQENIESILISSLQHGESYNGAIAIYPAGDREFTPAELSVFQSFSDLATMAVAVRNLMGHQREIAVMEERNRLAREIHDTVAQSLAALVLQIETAQTELNAGRLASVSSTLESATAQARKGLEDTRRAVQGLSPASLETQSTAAAIAELVKSFDGTDIVPTQFIMTGDEQPLQPEQSLALLRIAQEALNNAHKYARARRIRVGLKFNAESVLLRIEDDGIGFDAAGLPMPGESSGYGLFGMNERVRLLDGELSVDSTPGWGTRIQAELPYRTLSQTRGSTPALIPQLASPGIPASPMVGGLRTKDTEFLRVVVVDDHAIMRQGVRAMLEATGEVVVVGEARDGAEAVHEALKLRPDVLLMDLQMPGVDGLEGLKQLHSTMPDLPVVVLTTFYNQDTVAQAMSYGARGYILKDAGATRLLAAIKSAYQGETVFSAAVSEAITERAALPAARPEAETLNERELEVLEQLAQGARNKEIAERLFVVPRTVEYHLANIYAKLGVSNRTEAVREALDRGLVSQAPRGLK